MLSLFLSPQKALTSEKWYWQYYGAIFDGRKEGFFNAFLIFLCIGDVYLLFARVYCDDHSVPFLRVITFLLSFGLLYQTVRIVAKLNVIFCLREQETRITWSQIALLVVIGLFVVSFVEVINPSKDSPESMMLGGAGLVLGWIFQDTIRSVAAFFHLRINGLLKINDWIEVSSHRIDGMVRHISLTTVTIENWDTTTSSVPTYILHAEHFKNNQKMMDGKTHGRQMLKTFTIDTGWIHYMKNDELEKLKGLITKNCPKMDGFYEYYVDNLKPEGDGLLNIRLYRYYIYFWLMKNEHVSHEPRLIVRWLEQTNEGLPLQVYAFITDSNLAPFEWQQSQIIEHVVESMAWFNLQMYQSPSGYDASNSNITMVERSADYRKEQTYE